MVRVSCPMHPGCCGYGTDQLWVRHGTARRMLYVTPVCSAKWQAVAHPDQIWEHRGTPRQDHVMVLFLDYSSAWQTYGWIPRNFVTERFIRRTSTLDLTALLLRPDGGNKIRHTVPGCYQPGDNCEIYFHTFYKLFTENVRAKYQYTWHYTSTSECAQSTAKWPITETA